MFENCEERVHFGGERPRNALGSCIAALSVRRLLVGRALVQCGRLGAFVEDEKTS